MRKFIVVVLSVFGLCSAAFADVYTVDVNKVLRDSAPGKDASKI